MPLLESVPLRSFFLCYPGEALEGPISTGVSNKLNNIDSNNGILISKKYYTIYIYISSLNNSRGWRINKTR